MPHRPTQQQHFHLSSPEPYLSSILGGGSTPTKHPNPITTKFSPQNPDLIKPSNIKPSPSFMLKHFSSLNIVSHKPGPPQKPSLQTKNHLYHPHPPPPPPPPSPPLVDTHLQGKPMASSAIAISAPKLISKRPSKEKPLKCKKEVERTKLVDEEGVMKKGSHFAVHQHSKILFEDDIVSNKVEKNSRVIIPPVVDEKKHDDEDDDVVVKRHSVSLSHQPSNGGGNRRRSFCGSQVVVDLCDVFAVNGVKVVSADMPPFMQIHAVDCARKAFDSMEKFTSKTLALTLKKEFDGVYGPAWHCIVGTNFGSFVTHSVGGFLYFSMDQKYYILLFKTAVQKAG